MSNFLQSVNLSDTATLYEHSPKRQAAVTRGLTLLSTDALKNTQ